MRKKIYLFSLLAAVSIGLTASAQTQQAVIHILNYDTDEKISEKQTASMDYSAPAYIVEDFLGCGCPVSFVIPHPTDNGWYYNVIFMPDSYDIDGGVAYIRNPETGEHPVIKIPKLEGDGEYTLSNPNFTVNYGDMHFNKMYYFGPDSNEERPVMTELCLGGDESETNGLWFKTRIYFQEASKVGASVESVESDGAAEYYTLQGTRVFNPGHGIFIERKNGNNTKKYF